ncbi:MAG TPA: hypothetical protein VEY11_20230 [Pyrinomonadaceae bacterium]|nr:hypothetical protein [Pyrinomonadaceae bacterium]
MSPDQFLVRYSSPLLALVILVGASLLLDRFNPKNDIIERLGKGYFSTDQTPFYRPQQLFDMLDRYSEEDRRAHVRFIYLDLIYPLIYSVTAAILLAYLLPVLVPPLPARFTYLSLLPFAVAVFDYLENLSLLYILQRYGANNRPFGMACFSSVMTTSKLFLMYATAALFLIGLVTLVVKGLRAARR